MFRWRDLVDVDITATAPRWGKGCPMGVQRRQQTAQGQAALLFCLAGCLGLVSERLHDSGAMRSTSIAVNLTALLVGVAVHLAPWDRWPERSTLALVPFAFALLAVGQRVAPGAPSSYGVWFVVVFAWVGFWHPPRTAAWLAPIGAVAYVAPFIGVPWTPEDAIASVTIAIPAAAILGEVLSSKMDAINRTQRELVEARTLLERANLTDDLTGVGNRRRANLLLESMAPGDGLLLLDLDHFKAVNDRRGHAEGDRILSALGDYLRSAVREADTVARFGGEEFLVLLRGSGDQVGDAGTRLLEGWRAEGAGVTLSAGAAVHTDSRGPSDTFKATDRALYRAKDCGRDRLAMEDRTAPVLDRAG
jgi:diguanylate cyclase (GGDEF)-like protein